MSTLPLLLPETQPSAVPAASFAAPIPPCRVASSVSKVRAPASGHATVESPVQTVASADALAKGVGGR